MKLKFKVLSMTLLTLSSSLFAKTPTAKEIASNPLVQVWNTPSQTPPFTKIKVEHYKPAFEFAIAQARQEIDAICNARSMPTFENTVVALDRVGGLLNKVSGIFFNVTEAESTPETQAISKEVTPILTDYSNDVSLNETLFQRVKAVYDMRDKLDLNPEQKMLLDKTYKSFARNGANLNAEDKEKYRKISQELSDLSLQFRENILKETNDFNLHITNEADLNGLPTDAREQAAQAAKALNKEGWVFDLSQPSYFAFTRYADNRELRKQMYTAYNTRAFRGNENDNQKVILRLTQLRLEMAQLLGYPTYADYILEERMAEKSDKVNTFLEELLKVSLPYAKRDVEELQAYAKSLGLEDDLQRWDFSYYSEKLRTEKYNINDEVLKPYFELNSVTNGIFELCNRLYGLKFVPNTKIAPYQKDVKVYDVFDASGKEMAVLYMDFYARPSKRGGAWMTSFREQYIDENGKDVRPLVSLVLNFPAPVGNEPVLLTFNDFSTFLHEFGHALHGMLSECTYQATSGTNVPRDFVELPSQIMENWGTEKEFLDLFAKHYKTGEKLSAELIKKLVDAENFQAGYGSIRQLMFAILDMKWHSLSNPSTMDVPTFENTVTAEAEVLPMAPGMNTSVAFSHIFGGGYAAGYYGYKWAEVLDADAFSVFKENGIFDAKTAESFRKNILSKGGSVKPMELYINFRGKEPQMDALLERSGMKL